MSTSHKNTKQIKSLKYFLDDPLRYGGLKRIQISSHNNATPELALRTFWIQNVFDSSQSFKSKVKRVEYEEVMKHPLYKLQLVVPFVVPLLNSNIRFRQSDEIVKKRENNNDLQQKDIMNSTLKAFHMRLHSPK